MGAREAHSITARVQCCNFVPTDWSDQQNVQQWLLGARNCSTVIIERMITPWWRTEDWTFADDFLRLFDTSFQKKRKKSCFFEIWKKTKNMYYRTLGNSLRQTVSHPLCLCLPSSKIDSSPLKGCGGNCRPSGKKWQLTTARFMTHVTCKLTAKNRDQLRDHRPTLGNRIGGLRATFTFNVNPEYKNKTHNSVWVLTKRLQ